MKYDNLLFSSLALIAAIYHISYSFILQWGSGVHTVIHVGFVLGLAIFSKITSSEGWHSLVLRIMVLIVLIMTVYFTISAPRLEVNQGIRLTDMDLVMIVLMLITVIITTWLVWGKLLAIIPTVGILYYFFGSLLPGAIRAPHLPSLEYGMSYLATPGSTGVFGQLTPVSANIIFLFILFGAVLGATGVLDAFVEIGKSIGKRIKGGSAFTAIFGSSFLGSVTGSTVANVSLTGAFTIPLMKRTGYRPKDAASIEAISSCGGQITPPIMGAGAFIMASITGTPYILIAGMAVFPAILYYVSVIIAVLFLIRSRGIADTLDSVDYRLMITKLPLFLIPIGVIIYLLVIGMSPAMAVIWALLTSIALPFFNINTILSLRKILAIARKIIDGMIEGAIQGASIGLILVAISIFVQVVITSMLGPKFVGIFQDFLSGSIILALVAAMIACIILGFGMPTVAAYSLVAFLIAPALVKLGVDLIPAHFFLFFFAVYAAVTPPIATAIFVASKIADSKFWPTAWSSMRLMIGPILIPYFFVFQPSILGFPNIGINTLFAMVAFILLIVCISTFINKILLIRLNLLEYIVSFISFVTGLLWVYYNIIDLFVLTLLLFCILTISQLMRFKSEKNRGNLSLRNKTPASTKSRQNSKHFTS